MATLRKCACGNGFPAVRYRADPSTPEGERLICRLCDDRPHIAPAPILAFIREVGGLCTSIEYLGNGNADHIPALLAIPIIRKGRDLLDQYLFPRFRMWETKDPAGHTVVHSGAGYRRIAIPYTVGKHGKQHTVPLDLFVGHHG